MNFRVRPYELNDLTAIAEIEKQCFESPWTYSAFCMEYADKNKYYFVAEADNGEIIGYGGFAHVIDEADIMNIAVKEGYRRQGVAFAILSALLQKAKQLNVHGVTLEVNDLNSAAIALYEKVGFTMSGLRPHYYGWDKPARIYWYYFPEKTEDRSND